MWIKLRMCLCLCGCLFVCVCVCASSILTGSFFLLSQICSENFPSYGFYIGEGHLLLTAMNVTHTSFIISFFLFLELKMEKMGKIAKSEHKQSSINLPSS